MRRDYKDLMRMEEIHIIEVLTQADNPIDQICRFKIQNSQRENL